MPHFRLYSNDCHDSDSPVGSASSSYDDAEFDDQLESAQHIPRRRSKDGRPSGPTLVSEGKSGRVVPDRDLGEHAPDQTESAPYSSYDVAGHGPSPAPDWLITSLSARDTPLGSLKSGKEADVSVLDRSIPGGPGCLLAVKTYRDSRHRMFHRDSGYQEGRRVRRSREGRAMAARTTFGRDLCRRSGPPPSSPCCRSCGRQVRWCRIQSRSWVRN